MDRETGEYKAKRSVTNKRNKPGALASEQVSDAAWALVVKSGFNWAVQAQWAERMYEGKGTWKWAACLKRCRESGQEQIQW